MSDNPYIDVKRVHELFQDWKQLRSQGGNPSLIELVPHDTNLRKTLADVIADPDLADELFATIIPSPDEITKTQQQNNEQAVRSRDKSNNSLEIPGYSINDMLGEGGMGIVFKAVQVKLNRIVAIKMINNIKTANSKEISRFLTEAESVAAIDHPHVVRVYDSGNVDGRPYIAMEFLSGGSLHDRLRKYGPMKPMAAAHLIRKLALAVQAAHDEQIVHRDLKPANILFDTEGEPRICDFGLAKRADSGDLTSTHAVMGTPAYMAPEQAIGESKFVSHQADIWALGVIFYECITGKKPFVAVNNIETIRLVAEKEHSDMRTIRKDVPVELDLIVSKCLEKDPTSRYRSAKALARDLKKWIAGKEISLLPATRSERLLSFIGRNRYAVSIISVLIICLISFLLISSMKNTLRDYRYQIDNLERDKNGLIEKNIELNRSLEYWKNRANEVNP